MAAVVGWAATVEGQVSGLPGERQVVLSLSLFYFLFSIFLQIFGFIKNTRTYSKIM